MFRNNCCLGDCHLLFQALYGQTAKANRQPSKKTEWHGFIQGQEKSSQPLCILYTIKKARSLKTFSERNTEKAMKSITQT